MLGSSFLDIAIGIVFVFLLLSLIASTVNEIILSFLNERGKKLLLGLQTLLSDTGAKVNGVAEVNGLVEKIYNHGQIYGLFKGPFDAKKPDNLPSYIPATNFVMALLDVVPAAAAELPTPDPPPAALQAAEQAAQRATDLATKMANQLAAAEDGGPADAQAAAARAAAAAKVACLRLAALKLADHDATKKVGIPLLAMIEVAASDVDTLKAHVEDWYNSAMDRVSGWYKYHTQTMLFFIGLVLALALNADTIRIVQQLSKNPTLRESIIAAAQSAASAQSKTNQGNGSDQANIPNQLTDLSTKINGVEELGIPLGWPPPAAITNLGLLRRVWQSARPILERPSTYLGWLLTAIAVSLGAPFWFDMLNKIMIVRSTVKPGEKSQPAKDKEKK